MAYLQPPSHVVLISSSQETNMKFALIGAVAVAAAAFAAPVMAQPVVEDPGYCAQFYPNANCQNFGPGNPYTDSRYYHSDPMATTQAAEANAYRYHGGPKYND
jgi:hypothetical protein